MSMPRIEYYERTWKPEVQRYLFMPIVKSDQYRLYNIRYMVYKRVCYVNHRNFPQKCKEYTGYLLYNHEGKDRVREALRKLPYAALRDEDDIPF